MGGIPEYGTQGKDENNVKKYDIRWKHGSCGIVSTYNTSILLLASYNIMIASMLNMLIEFIIHMHLGHIEFSAKYSNGQAPEKKKKKKIEMDIEFLDHTGTTPNVPHMI